MRRAALYSSAGKQRPVVESETPDSGALSNSAPIPADPPTGQLKGRLQTHRNALFAAATALAVIGGIALDRHFAEPQRVITQRDIDRAVRTSLEKKPLPSQAAKAYEVIRPSIVRVDGFDHPEGLGSLPAPADPADKSKGKKEKGKEQKGKEPGKDDNSAKAPSSERQSVGTGVVITERGTILTNLHVVVGTSHIRVVFADGTESPAVVTGADPDNDLAVLQATKLPDDLHPATLITTGDLRPGDEVLAVGFPFGFGPSASTGVVSGLKREFVSSDGKRALSNLIQFDAAANPGNSGGPLVNMEGEVLGIVTAILNPLQQRFFVGLAFAVPIENAAAAVGIPPF